MISSSAVSLWLRAVALVTALALAGLPSAAPAQTPRAGLIVVHGDGRTLTSCIDLPAQTISGVELLVSSGLDLNLDASGGVGTAICRVDGEGCSTPKEDCFCRCMASPCTYWSYWQRTDGGWTYSSLGASSTTVRDGSVDAWVWNTGTIGRSADREPPALSFDDVCAPAPKSTSVDADTATPTAAASPVIDFFRADYGEIAQGESVSLRWNLYNAEQAFLRYDGLEEGVTSPGGRAVTPAVTTTYILVARGPGGEVQSQVTVAVIPAPPTVGPPPVTAPPAIPTAAPVAAAGAPQAAVPAATATLAPTSTPLPTATPGWVTWETTPLTGALVVVMPASAQVVNNSAVQPVIVNPTPRPDRLVPNRADAPVVASPAGRLALSLSAVVLPVMLALVLLAARRRR